MSKMYKFLYLANIICGIFLFYNYLFVYNLTKYNIPIMIGIFIVYLLADILFFRKRFLLEKIDLVIATVYIFTCVAVFMYSLFYQVKVYDVFSMVYINCLLIVPHFTYIIYNLIRCYK